MLFTRHRIVQEMNYSSNKSGAKN